ncbi:hypothetical protein N7494_012004 [Penicillium frequentans]|uniref:Protein kinase domain-containing protein n=1 Tax=Penicillium frequentans TaxID=3151616 RepID=A0AAD6CKW4_9EURO|nr:hypothetical protein N7494_012004 [Penicillium glabrum]
MADPGTIISAAETCYKYGKMLVKFCQDWKHADDELSERVSIVEICWAKTNAQIDLVQRLQPIMETSLSRILDDNFTILQGKLWRAATKIENVQDTSSQPKPGIFGFHRRTKGFKYALEKEAIDEVIRDMEDWQRRSEPSWFLIMRIANPFIDEELHRAATNTPPIKLASNVRDAVRPSGAPPSVELPKVSFKVSNIPFSRMKIGLHLSKNTHYIIDTLIVGPNKSAEAMEHDVRDLAVRLTKADSSVFGLLSCKGFMPIHEKLSPDKKNLQGVKPGVLAFDLVFRVPENHDLSQVQSLRHLLLRNTQGSIETLPSLSWRMQLAQELAKSISYVHTFGFVHKSVCPESILLLKNISSGASPSRNGPSAFLVGFDGFRSANAETALQGNGTWELDIYNHPQRQGEHPSDAYKMQHDIYSLGVCLLEIGLWQSFVQFPISGTKSKPQPSQVFEAFTARLNGGEDVSQAFPVLLSAAPADFKVYLVELARKELPRRVGDKYTEVVVTCLSCLDQDNDFGEEADIADDDGILVGARFIETVHTRLTEILI